MSAKNLLANLWAEYSPGLGLLKVYQNRLDSPPLELKVAGQSLMVSEDWSIPFPLNYDLTQTVAAVTAVDDGVSSASVRVAISAEEMHAVFGAKSFLFEDWENRPPACAQCGCGIDIPHTPRLLPSATWGFEDMRVCEECGPLTCEGSKKNRLAVSEILFIGANDVFVKAQSQECRCSDCGCVLGQIEACGTEVGFLKSLAPNSEWMRIPKSVLSVSGIAKQYPQLEHARTQIVCSTKRSFFLKRLSDCLLLLPTGEVYWAVKCLMGAEVTDPSKFESLESSSDEIDFTYSLPPSWSPVPEWRVCWVPQVPKLVDDFS